MRILIIGSGGREHAIAWKLAQDPETEKLFIAPGNGGTEALGENVAIDPSDIQALVEFAKNNAIDLVIPGPELPLTLGIADAMKENGIPCFGPDKFCAQLEGSKSFAKDIMAKSGVPTAKCHVFNDIEKARQYVKDGPQNLVIKADGLAAGKGVVLAANHAEAISALEEMLANKKFGAAGARVVIEEKLEGEEVSLLCFCDGLQAVPLPSAQDHKAAFDNDLGPNTGGMGAYSPAPILPDSRLEELTDITIRPILKTMAQMGHPFKGILYAGLMITKDGPKVLEYNVRFGDPECEPIMLRMKSSLASHMLACINGKLDGEAVVFDGRSALGVILASKGYPGQYEKGMRITSLNDLENDPDIAVFHCGTKNVDGNIIANGGRVLCVTALGHTLQEAKNRAYECLEKIHMPESRHRNDIGQKGINRLKTAN